eukprot:m.117519 g.117519  ORF g.117519 m.117519 type:complete len:335 (-) comp9519_c0_seq2:803-1807(-)
MLQLCKMLCMQCWTLSFRLQLGTACWRSPCLALCLYAVRRSTQLTTACAGRHYLLFNGHMEHLCTCDPIPNTAPIRFRGTADAFLKLYHHEGLSSLWRGLPPTLLMAVPQTVMYFTAYDYLRHRMDQDRWYTPMLAGTLSRTGAVTVISPVELLRTKMQARGKISYSGLAQTLSSAVHREGFFSLWRGLGPTLLRDVPFSAIYWTGFEFARRRYQRAHQTHEKALPFSYAFASGAVCGSIAAILTLPFDVIKTHMQSTLGDAPSSKFDSATKIFRDILSKQGWQGLFVGIIPRIAKVAPACAIMISTYEASKAFFLRRNALAATEVTEQPSSAH